MNFLPYLYMQMFWGKKVKQGRKMSEMSIESFVQAKESTIDDWAFGSLVKCKLKIFKNINWLASIYNPGGVSANFFFFSSNHYKVILDASTMFIDFHCVKCKNGLWIELWIDDGMQFDYWGNKMKFEFAFFESFENINQSLLYIYLI